jgi:hypothetical protein
MATGEGGTSLGIGFTLLTRQPAESIPDSLWLPCQGEGDHMGFPKNHQCTAPNNSIDPGVWSVWQVKCSCRELSVAHCGGSHL